MRLRTTSTPCSFEHRVADHPNIASGFVPAMFATVFVLLVKPDSGSVLVFDVNASNKLLEFAEDPPPWW